MAIATWNWYKLGDLIQVYTKTGLPFFKWYKSRFKGLGYFLFEPQEVEYMTGDSKKTAVILKPKNIDGITPMLTRDGKGIYWWEYSYQAKEVKVNWNQANVTTVTVKAFDQYDVNDFQIDDKVIIYSTADNREYYARISAVDTANSSITLVDIKTSDGTSVASISVNDNDIVSFVFNVKNTSDTINSSFRLKANKEYVSYFSFITGEISFTQNELNVTYQYPEAVEEYVKAKLSRHTVEQIRQIAQSIYFGQNVSPDNGKTETLGIITWIRAAGLEVGNDSNLFVDDYSSATDDDKAKWFVDSLYRAWESNVYDNGVITLIATAGAVKKIQQLMPAFYRINGQVLQTTKTGSLGLEVTEISNLTAGFKVEYFTDAILNEYAEKSIDLGSDFVITIPKSKIGLYQLTNKGLDINGKLMKYGPNLEFEDITQYTQYNKVGKDTTFVTRGHFALLPAGITTGAYRIIKL